MPSADTAYNSEFLGVRHFNNACYSDLWQAMKDFTDQRNSNTHDELWLVEHQAVFTQGQAGKAEHILQSSDIPIVQSDRGGQVTYHGPGQLVAYCLIDLKRKSISVRECVSLLEQCILQILQHYGIDSHLKDGAPGVYVAGKKIASLGLRVRKGCTYHGLSLNINMDLAPFQLINPCGYQGLAMTQMAELAEPVSMSDVETVLLERFQRLFSYQKVIEVDAA